VGETLFYGRGAGQDPTSSSVISDLADAATAVVAGAAFVPRRSLPESRCRRRRASAEYHPAVGKVEDKPGVLAQVAGILGAAGRGHSRDDSAGGGRRGRRPRSAAMLLHDATYGVVKTYSVGEIWQAATRPS